jgi:formylmethanofuran dehydrogenase subunit E
MTVTFRDFINEVKPVKFREPLAETLGAFRDEGAVLEYTFAETVKMAGHACPTVAGAYLSCQKALEALYGGEIPERGGIAVTVYGEPDEGVYGVMGQVFSFLTGAAPASGFRGLGHKFSRKDLLRFDKNKIDPQAMCFEFKRTDNGKKVLVKFYPQKVPFAPEKAMKMGQLMEKVLWEAAKPEEREEFRQLWTEKVGAMLVEQRDISDWLTVEKKED